MLIFRAPWSPALKTGFFMLSGSKALILTTENTQNSKTKGTSNAEFKI